MEKRSSGQSNPADRRSLPRRLLRWAIFAAAQLLIIAVVLEVVLRFVDPGGISYYPETADYMDTLVVDTDGYRNRPGLRGRFYGAEVSINSLGMRDREVPEVKPDGEFRIMVMGDSVPFGIGVSHTQSIPGQIEAIANQSAAGKTTIRTLNMGVPSYNTEQELTQFRTLAARLQPDLVVLIYCLNDIKPKMWVFEKRSSLIADLAQRSYAASGLFVTLRNMRMRGASAADMLGVTGYEAGDPQWQAVAAGLGQLQQECRKRNVPLVVVTHLEFESGARALLDETGKKEGFAVIPPRPVADPRWNQLQQDVKLQNSRCDSHPNATGCEIYAQLIVNELVRAGLLPTVEPKTGETSSGRP